MKRILGILLDVDGTLVDSNDAHASARSSPCGKGNHGAHPESSSPDRHGPATSCCRWFRGIPGNSPEATQIGKRRQEIFATRYLPYLRPTKGAAQLGRTSECGRIPAWSRQFRQGSRIECLVARLRGRPDHRAKTSSDEADNSKPDPDIIHAALKRIGLQASDGGNAGRHSLRRGSGHPAGVGVIAVRCGGWDDHGLTGALAIYDDPCRSPGTLRRFPTGSVGKRCRRQREAPTSPKPE